MRTRAIASSALLTLAAVASLAGQAAQQEPPSAVGLVRKNKAPVSNEVLKVNLPKPQEADLPSGLHLMVLEDHRLPRVSFQIVIPGAGGYYDAPAMTGLSSYTAQMMREGTKTRNSQQISQELEMIAASLGVSGSIAGTSAAVSGGALSEHFPQLFDMAAEVLLNPSFPAEEWDRLKARAREPAPAAHAAGVPRERDVLEGGVRRASGGAELGHAGDARRDHARRDGRGAPHAVRA